MSNERDGLGVPEGYGTLRYTCLMESPEDAFSPEFLSFMKTAWPEEEADTIPPAFAFKTIKWVIENPEHREMSEVGGMAYSAMVNYALNSLERHEVAEQAAQYGLILDGDNEFSAAE